MDSWMIVDYRLTDVILSFYSMKKGLHPETYRAVVFQDLNNGFSFLTRSTVATNETIVWEDGNSYPLIKVHISSASHPFFTGEERVVDIEGRVDKFKARAAAAEAAKSKQAAAAQKKNKRAAQKASEEKTKIDSKSSTTESNA
jgi:large subunit ribosomal protein L31